jgi:DNA-binding NarL/FixJ family response regulator
MRVLLADHHRSVRWALRTAIREEPDMVVIGEASDSRSLESQAQALSPDVVLLEWELPGQPPAAVVLGLRTLDPRPRVVVLGQRSELEMLALGSGADAFVSKIGGPEGLLTILRGLVGSDRAGPNHKCDGAGT